MEGKLTRRWPCWATALALVETTGGRWWEAELQRLKGELLLRTAGTEHQGEGTRAKVADAETCLRQALAVARRQQARSLELRAAIGPGPAMAEPGPSALRPTRCWHRSTVGSAKALTPPTSRRPGVAGGAGGITWVSTPRCRYTLPKRVSPVDSSAAERGGTHEA